ncbi:hypothetical protein ACUN0C_15535 [Faunimonas sp. B44]|uniref:hypothetical protein n=1 Tax=Faunimonas sp. B44 TaxID=3461493 RepID=UPI004044A8A9
MPEQSSMHDYLNWTKERIDEMDATLAALEGKAAEVKAESQAMTEEAVAELTKQRDGFQAQARALAEAGGSALLAGKGQLEAQWRDFEARVKAYFETVGKQIGQQQATFQEIAAAQVKAWREAAETFNGEAAKLAAAKRADVDAAVKQMKADAAEAEARLRTLKQAGSESWAAMSAALAESRKAFDQANQKAWEALKRATPPSA